MAIEGSAVFDYQDVKWDGKTETNIFEVRYEIYDVYHGVGLLLVGDLAITNQSVSNSKSTWKFTLFDGTTFQGETPYGSQPKYDVIKVLNNYFLDERKRFRIIKTDEHQYRFKCTHRDVVLTFTDNKVTYDFPDLGFSAEIEAGDLEAELIDYLKKQAEAGTDYPVDDNIYWVFWFSRHFNDDRLLKLLKDATNN